MPVGFLLSQENIAFWLKYILGGPLDPNRQIKLYADDRCEVELSNPHQNVPDTVYVAFGLVFFALHDEIRG